MSGLLATPASVSDDFGEGKVATRMNTYRLALAGPKRG
jgi:hypothetical protein